MLIIVEQENENVQNLSQSNPILRYLKTTTRSCFPRGRGRILAWLNRQLTCKLAGYGKPQPQQTKPHHSEPTRQRQHKGPTIYFTTAAWTHHMRGHCLPETTARDCPRNCSHINRPQTGPPTQSHHHNGTNRPCPCYLKM